MPIHKPCPSCRAEKLVPFYQVMQVPVHSVVLLPTREEALSFPVGDIVLGFCQRCGFITNTAFDPAVQDYSSRYESTQAYSPTFDAFSRQSAVHLINRHNLHGKTIVEIGCGQGEFLYLLCRLGGNFGVGFDPAFRPERTDPETLDSITFVQDYYSELYAQTQADFICCKMTLEHIQPVAEFVSMVRRTIGERPDTVVFFQVPDVTRIVQKFAFWDIYYEHCSYFSLGSLSRLFRSCGFDIISVARDYGDQYLMLEARPETGESSTPAPEVDLAGLQQELATFSDNCSKLIQRWRQVLARMANRGERAVVWGGGSKGVAFLTTLGVCQEIPYAVDVNPNKHGTFMAGTGQEIVSPEFLKEYRPDVVIVMNPIYCDEIQRELDILGIKARLVPVES